MMKWPAIAALALASMIAANAGADPALAPPPPLLENAPTVVFYQLEGIGLIPPEPAQFYIDGKKVASLVNRACVTMRVPTGVHTVTEKYGNTLAFYGPLSRMIGVNAVWTVGQTYFYRIDIDREYRVFSWRLTVPDAQTAAQETAGIKCAEKSWADAGR